MNSKTLAKCKLAIGGSSGNLGVIGRLVDGHILYLCSQNLIAFDLETQTQRLITDGSSRITCVAIAPNKKIFAVCETKGISIIAAGSFSVRKKLSAVAGVNTPVLQAAFTEDGQLLLTVSRHPAEHHSLVATLWKLDTPDQVNTGSFLVGTLGPILALNAPAPPFGRPSDPVFAALHAAEGGKLFAVIALQTDGVRFMRVDLSSRDSLKVIKGGCGEFQQSLVAGQWFGESLILAGSGGDVYISKSEDLSSWLRCPIGGGCITSMVAFDRGLALGSSRGLVKFFERGKTSSVPYTLTRQVAVLPEESFCADCISGRDCPCCSVTGLVTNESQSLLTVSFRSGQFYRVDIIGTGDPCLALANFPSGRLLSLDVCVARNQLLAAWAPDQGRSAPAGLGLWTWNKQSIESDLVSYFQQEQENVKLVSVALHPSSFIIAASFTAEITKAERVVLFAVESNKLKPLHTISVRSPGVAVFNAKGDILAVSSHTGVLFLRLTESVPVLISSPNLNAPARFIIWLDSTTAFVSTASGRISFFQVKDEAHRICEIVQLKDQVLAVCLADRGCLVALANGVVFLNPKTPPQPVNFTQVPADIELSISSIKYLDSAGWLFLGLSCGKIILLKLRGEYSYGFMTILPTCHSTPVSLLAISPDGKHLYSAGADGVILTFALTTGISANSPFFIDVEVLVGKDELNRVKQNIESLKKHLGSLEAQLKSQVTSKQEEYSMELQILHDKNDTALQQRYSDQSELEHRARIAAETASSTELSLTQSTLTSESEAKSHFEKKLHQEETRYTKVSAELAKEKEAWAAWCLKHNADHHCRIDGIKQTAEVKLAATRENLAQARTQVNLLTEKYLNEIDRCGIDFEKQAVQVKEQLEAQVLAEKEDRIRVRGELGIFRKEHEEVNTLAKAKEKELAESRAKTNQLRDLQGIKARQIEANKFDISTRETLMTEKDQRINECRKQLQELEKFKALLEFQHADLKVQLQPKNEQLRTMKDEITLIDKEIDVYGERNHALDLEIVKLVAQQDAVTRDSDAAKDLMQTQQAHLDDIAEDLNLVADPMTAEIHHLRRSLLFIHAKHVAGHAVPTIAARPAAERRRGNVENSIATLKSRLGDAASNYRRDIAKLKREEAELVISLNKLRKEEYNLKKEIEDMKN